MKNATNLGYLVAATGGMLLGGIAVAVLTNLIPRMMDQMMDQMMARMADRMQVMGCDPGDM